MVDPGAVLKRDETGGVMFKMGLDNNTANALVIVSNTSIRASSGRYTVDFTSVTPHDPFTAFVTCKNVDNFQVSDFHILDNFTGLSSLTFNYASHNGQYFRPRNGVIKNGHVDDAHYGYGLVQAKIGYNILFKDLSAVGGVTWRLESGGIDPQPPGMDLDQFYARNISVTNCHATVMLGSHGLTHGHIDIDGASAVSSGQVVGGGLDFADSSIIRNVHAVFGTNAQHKTKNFKDIPPQVRRLISTNPVWWVDFIYEGPAANVVSLNNLNITVSNVTATGFEYLPNLVGWRAPYETLTCTLADVYIGCNPVPVDGVTLSETRLSLSAAQNVQLSATVSPADATDHEVNWTTDNPAVVIVSENGNVLATGPGTCTITGRTVDWGYPATCQVTVAGPETGRWNELTRDDFESGWGNWVSGGIDAFLSTNNAVGAQCVNLQDDSSTSHMDLSNPLDLMGYAFLKIEFSMVASGFDQFEYMAVEFSDDGGSSWSPADDRLYDFEFENGERYGMEILMESGIFNFTSNSKIRIRCNSSRDAEIAYIDNVVISAFSLDEWEQYFSRHGLSGFPDADEDGDGQEDLIEYAFGGNPTNRHITGVSPRTESNEGTASYYYLQLTNSNPGITYVSEWTEDLVSGPWINEWDTITSNASTNVGFNEVEHQIDWSAKPRLFMRLRVSRP